MKSPSFVWISLFVVFIIYGCEKIPPYVNQKPIASVIASPTEGDKPLNVRFDASLSSDPEDGLLNYSWDFGNSSSSTGIAPSKTFNETGSFTVTLTVTDEEGLQDTDQVTIRVNEPPPPPNLFPVAKNAQWVYFVKSTDTENGAVSDYDEGYTYLILENINLEYEYFEAIDIRITGKRYYNKTSLVSGEYIYMLHKAGDYIKIAHQGDDSYSHLVNYGSSSWSNYAMFFSGSSSQSVSMSAANMTIGLGTFETFKVKHQRDNWGEQYVSERYDISETEYLSPEIGLVYRNTSRYVNFRDCFTCPVYGGSSEIELVGYYIPQPDGSIIEGGTGYNPNNPYGGDLGMKTFWANEDIGYTEIKLDNEYVGTIGNYWESKPSCGHTKALNVSMPDGSYNLTAESSKGYTWEGTVYYTAGECNTLELTLSGKGFRGGESIGRSN